MRLRTINRWLSRVGLVLVMRVDDSDPHGSTVFTVMRRRSYLALPMSQQPPVAFVDV